MGMKKDANKDLEELLGLAYIPPDGTKDSPLQLFDPKVILTLYISKQKVVEALDKFEYDNVRDTPADSQMKQGRNELRDELRNKLA